MQSFYQIPFLFQVNAKSETLRLCIKKISKLIQRTSSRSCCCYLSLSLYAIHYQNVNSLSGNNVLYKFQSGFRKFYLTDFFAISPWQNHKRFQYQYQKAFDTIDHTILILKIRFLCFTDETSKWNTSYFSNRQLNISIENTYSNKASIRFILYRKVQFWVHCSFALY